MSTLARFRQFKPPGPVAASFMSDKTHFVRSLRGPVGGGKTVTCIFDHLRNASEMPVCNDGEIHFRLAVVGVTYGQLERNLYRTWQDWLPYDGGDWTSANFVGGGGRSGTHRIEWDIIRDGRRVKVNFEAIFAAIGELAVEQFMRGFEPTAFWLFEMDLLPKAVLDTAITRLGRYPKRVDIKGDVPYRSYLVGDLNAPDIDSWYYETFEADLPEGFKQYSQPGGMSPKAENLHNLPRGYYDRQVASLKNKHLVKRFVHNEYAPSLDGEPVYAEDYSDDVHFSKQPLEILPNVPIEIGLDAGVQRPAAVIGQMSSKGQFRVLAECVPGRMNARRFCERVKLLLEEIAPGRTIESGFVDPTAFNGADKEGGDLAWAETCMIELGCPIQPAPSNELDLRIGAVKEELSYSIEANVPALVIDPRCRMVRKGFASHYRFRKERVGTTERTSDQPEKNDYSHPHDALQYWVLGKKGRYGAIAGAGHAKGAHAAPPAASSSVVMKSNIKLF